MYSSEVRRSGSRVNEVQLCSKFKSSLALPVCPRLVVIRIAPLAPRTPNTAVAEASFSTDTLSTSSALR